jgi:hypothetical protein
MGYDGLRKSFRQICNPAPWCGGGGVALQILAWIQTENRIVIAACLSETLGCGYSTVHPTVTRNIIFPVVFDYSKVCFRVEINTV